MSNNMLERVIIAGFGGQGILLMGQLLAYGAMIEGHNATWLPSYGPEMRGGTANCTVVISSKRIASPVVPKPFSVIAMNRPSLDKFEPAVAEGGLLLFNSSLADREPGRDDLQVIKIPANELAEELKNLKVANMIALGAYLTVKKVIALDSALASLEKVLSERGRNLIPLNEKALRAGADFVKSARAV